MKSNDMSNRPTFINFQDRTDMEIEILSLNFDINKLSIIQIRIKDPIFVGFDSILLSLDGLVYRQQCSNE